MSNKRPPDINVAYYTIPQKITPAKKKKEEERISHKCPCPHHHSQGTGEKAALLLSKKLIQGGQELINIDHGFYTFTKVHIT